MNAARFIAAITIVIALANALGGCAGDGMLIPEVPDYVMELMPGPNSMGQIEDIAIGDDGTIYMISERYHPLTWWRGYLLVSADKGESWAEYPLKDSYDQFVTVDKDGAVYLYSSGGTKITRSVDGGKHWMDIGGTLPGDISWIGSRLLPALDGNIYLSTREAGIFVYDTVGNMWSSRYDSLPWGDHNLYSMAFDEEGRIYAGTSDGLWRDDGAAGWTKFVDPPELAGRIEKILIGGDGRIYILDTRSRAMVSRDKGETWNEPLPGVYIYDLFVDRQGRIFVLNSSGLLVSTDGGFVFDEILQGQDAGNILINSHPDGEIFLYSENPGPGLQRSGDGASTWELIGFPYGDIHSIYTGSNGDLYALTNESGIWRLEKEGARWSCLSVEKDLINPSCIVESPEGCLVAGTSNGVFISQRDASSWDRVGGYISGVREIIYLKNGRMAGRTRSGVYLLDDAGASWIDIGMHGYWLTSIASFEGVLYASANFGGVFRYTGNGAVWEQVNAGLEDLKVLDLAVLPGAGLFALTSKGLFLLKEGASSWTPFYAGNDLEMSTLHRGKDVLYAGTAGDGILWTCPVASTMFECGIGVEDAGIPDISLISIYALQENPSGNLYMLGEINSGWGGETAIYRIRPIRAVLAAGDK